VRLYSNLERLGPQLRHAGCSAAASLRPHEEFGRPRQRHRRLSGEEIIQLIKAYEDHQPVHQIAQKFGIHRVTASALLRRHGAAMRCAGVRPEEVPVAVSLYGDGLSCARLGIRFGVSTTTIWRMLRAAGVAMGSQNQRHN
jgi:hypothetical protein